MIPSPLVVNFQPPPHFYSVDDLFPLILMVTEPFDIFQKSVGKDTHYQNVNTDGFESVGGLWSCDVNFYLNPSPPDRLSNILMIPSPLVVNFQPPPHFYSVDDLFPLILMVTEPFDIFQKSVGKDTHYQNVNTDGFESAFFHMVFYHARSKSFKV